MSAPLRFEENASLAARAAAGDAAACEQLVLQNGGLVRSIAVRFLDRGAEMEDLLQLGNLGLIKAARSFDAARGCAFSTYAVPLILGEIRRYLRDNGQLKVSRETKRLGAALLRESERIKAETGREPRLSELAAALSVSEEAAADALDAIAPVRSLFEPLGDEDGETLGSLLACAEDETETLCERMALSTALARLAPEERRLVDLRFRRELSQQQCAAILGVTQVRISRWEKKILERLRAELLTP